MRTISCVYCFMFRSGADGSRKFTAKVDATGTGKNFVAMTINTNGDAVSFVEIGE